MSDKSEMKKGLKQKLDDVRGASIVGDLPQATPIVDGDKKPLITGIENPKLKKERHAIA